jgi:hypothetical protein
MKLLATLTLAAHNCAMRIPDRRSRILALLALMAFTTVTGFAECDQERERFDGFLRKYNSWNRNGPKATLATVKAELGQPTSVEPSATKGMVKAVYALGECRGEVEFESTGYMWMTKVVKLEVLPTAEQQRQSGITEIDQKIAVLKQQIMALEEMRAGLAGSKDIPTISWAPGALAPNSTSPSTPPVGTPTPVSASAAMPQPPGSPAAVASTQPSGAYPDREFTTKGQPILTGPRGGRYHYSSSGNKVYERRSK